jgi:hypothetical protein
LSARLQRVASGILAAIGIALALWLAAGALAIVPVPRPVRVGLLPRVAVLAAIFGGVLVAMLLARRPLSRWLPLAVLSFAAVPWLPVPVPAASFLWTGPIASALVVVAIVAWILAEEEGVGARVCRALGRHRWLPFVLSLALNLGSYMAVAPRVPGGDEPHYLVVAHSLLADGDLKIENNHRRRDFAAFFGGDLAPHYLVRGANGQIYSVHAPGLPAVVLPAYALAGYPGVVVYLALVTALGAWLAWRIAFEVTGNAGAAWFGWAGVALSAPFVFHTFTVYPDGLAGVLVLTGIAALVGADRLSPGRLALHGAALALLPWLHTRFVLLAIPLGTALVFRLWSTRDDRRRIGAFLVVPVLSAAAWFAFFYAIYGTVDPRAPYGTYTNAAIAYVGAGLTGLLVDQQFGLFSHAPVFLVAFCGIVSMLGARRPLGSSSPRALARGTHGTSDGSTSNCPVSPRGLGVELLVVCIPYTLGAASYAMWWGGWSAPTRFLVPVLLVLAVPLATAWASFRSATSRAIAMVLLAVTALITLALVGIDRGALAYDVRTGFALWTEWVSPLADLTLALPAVHRDPLSRVWAQTAIWGATLVCTWLGLMAVERRWQCWSGADSQASLRGPLTAAPPLGGLAAAARPSSCSHASLWGRRLFASVAVPFAMALAPLVALEINWRLVGTERLRYAESQLRLLRRFDPPGRQVGVVWPSGNGFAALPGVVRGRDAIDELRVQSTGRRPPAASRWLELPMLPAGRYRVTAPAGSDYTGTVRVNMGATSLPAAVIDLPTTPRGSGVSPASFDLSWPVPIRSLLVVAERSSGGEGSATRPAYAMLAPLELTPSVKPLGDAARFAVRYGRHVVFFMDTRSYPEPAGFWTRPGGIELVISHPDASTPLRLTVRSGPVPTHVRLESGGWRQELAMPPSQATTISGPAGGVTRTSLLRIETERGFRPSALRKGIHDHRNLGVWVELGE